MTRIILALALAALWSAPRNAQALAVPDGKAAVAEAVIGAVSVNQGKGAVPLTVGQTLDFGAVVKTGANGRVSLRQAANAVTRMAPNTELTLNAPGARKGAFLSLATGFITFLVGKRLPGEAFEVETHNAVAAVKGTYAGVGTDGDKTDASVYESDHQPAMDLTDTGSGDSENLNPGETTTLDDSGFTTSDLTDDDKKHADDQMQGLPQPTVDNGPSGQGGAGNGGQGGTPPAGDQGNGTGSQGATGGELGGSAGPDDHGLDAALDQAFRDVNEQMGLDKDLEHQAHASDLFAGRIVFDRNHDQVQVSSYVQRPDPATVVLSTYTQRLTGASANPGVTYAAEKTVWNQALPQDWMTVAKTALNAASNLDVNGYAIFYKTDELFKAGNPFGDVLSVHTAYGAPYYYNAAGPGNFLYQEFLLTALADQTPLFVIHQTANGGITGGVGGLLGLTLAPDNTTGYVSGNNTADGNGVAYSVYAHPTSDPQGLSSSPYSVVLTQTMYQLDATGTLMPPPARVIPSQLTALTGNWTLPTDFRGLDPATNLEVVFDSSAFSAGHNIDLMVLPQMYDLMDMLNLPAANF